MGMEKISSEHHDAIESQPAIGRIVSVTGSQAVILLDLDAVMSPIYLDNRPDMGTLIKIDAKHTVTLGLISALSAPAPVTSEDEKEIWIAEVELVGELVKDTEGKATSFRRGVSSYPRLGDIAFLTQGHELEMAYSWSGSKTLNVGAISQAPEIPAMVRTDDLLGKHFAVLGTTGAGKSYTTALILRRILKQNPKAHILLLDPHNEYANSFKEMAEIITPADLQLPYWFLTFEELVEVIISEPEKNEAQIEILGDLIPIAKHKYNSANTKTAPSTDLLRAKVRRENHITVDTPTPYRLSDIIDMIKEKMGSLEHKNTLGPYKALKIRLESISMDSRYNFMFGSMSVQDNMSEILSRLFRLPVNNKPIAILQMTGLPLEIVNVVVSVLARLSFDIAQLSGGKIPITLVCEEAHRYIPNDKVSGFGPTRRSIAKIAKEGRKYGVSIAIITQRPSELDATILSMCNTVFAMRMANEKDQNIVSAAISDAAASMLAFLPSLGTGEAIVFGDGVTLPQRIRFARLPSDSLPNGGTTSFSECWSKEIHDDNFLDSIIDKWRHNNQGSDESPAFQPALQTETPSPVQSRPVRNTPSEEQYQQPLSETMAQPVQTAASSDIRQTLSDAKERLRAEVATQQIPQAEPERPTLRRKTDLMDQMAPQEQPVARQAERERRVAPQQANPQDLMAQQQQQQQQMMEPQQQQQPQQMQPEPMQHQPVMHEPMIEEKQDMHSLRKKLSTSMPAEDEKPSRSGFRSLLRKKK